MKRIIAFALFASSLSLMLCLPVRGGDILEYDMGESSASHILTDLEAAMPDEVREELPENAVDASSLSVSYFWDKLKGVILFVAPSFTELLCTLLGAVLLSALFGYLSESAPSGMGELFSAVSSLCVALCAYGGLQGVFSAVSTMLRLLTETMTVMTGAMEAVYIAGGNLTGAAVSATGIQLMISFTEAVFSAVLSPAAHASFVLAVAASVTGNGGVSYMARTLRGLITGVLVAAMALFCFVLSLQSGLCEAGDTLAAKTMKFAMGSYIPIVGGSVSETFSYMAAGLSVIKKGCGVLGILAVFLAFLFPFVTLISARLATGAASALAGTLGRGREAALLEECKSVCSFLLAVSAGAAAMYIIALGIFARASVAVA